MATFTIQKTVEGDQTTIEIQDAALTPLVMHYSYDNKEYRPYKLSEYTDALASAHSVRESIGDEFTLENLQTKYDEIMSMNVTPIHQDYPSWMSPLILTATCMTLPATMWRIPIPSLPPNIIRT